MINIRELTDEELDQQIKVLEQEDNSNNGIELFVAKRELQRRNELKNLEIHNLSVELNQEEWNRLGELAGEYCLSRSKLIEYFIRDLIWSREQGSDEHDIAYQWYSRSGCNHEHKSN